MIPLQLRATMPVTTNYNMKMDIDADMIFSPNLSPNSGNNDSAEKRQKKKSSLNAQLSTLNLEQFSPFFHARGWSGRKEKEPAFGKGKKRKLSENHFPLSRFFFGSRAHCLGKKFEILEKMKLPFFVLFGNELICSRHCRDKSVHLIQLSFF